MKRIGTGFEKDWTAFGGSWDRTERGWDTIGGGWVRAGLLTKLNVAKWFVLATAVLDTLAPAHHEGPLLLTPHPAKII